MKEFINNTNKKTIIIILFLVQLISLSFPVINHFIILNLGHEYLIEVQGYDPYDVLRGRYLSLSVVDDYIQLKEGELIPDNYKDYSKFKYIYIVLGENGDMGDVFEYGTFEKPINRDYIKTDNWNKKRVSEAQENTETENIYFRININKYYLNEELAPILEKKLRELEDNSKAYVSIITYKGNMILDKFIINNEIF